MQDEDAEIDTTTYSWADLSGAQQQAALTVFGYTALEWDNGNIDSDPSQAIKNSGGGRGGGNGGADDDYVFSVERGYEDVWVSKYQIVYFAASILIVVVGILGEHASNCVLRAI